MQSSKSDPATAYHLRGYVTAMAGRTNATGLAGLHNAEKNNEVLCLVPRASRSKTAHWPQRSKKDMLDLESEHSAQGYGIVR